MRAVLATFVLLTACGQLGHCSFDRPALVEDFGERGALFGQSTADLGQARRHWLANDERAAGPATIGLEGALFGEKADGLPERRPAHADERGQLSLRRKLGADGEHAEPNRRAESLHGELHGVDRTPAADYPRRRCREAPHERPW